MRKRMFLPIVLSLCMVQISTFAAPVGRGNARGSNAAEATPTSNAAPVAARAATRNTVKNTNTATTQPAAAPVSARAGNRQKVVSNPSATNAGQPMAARAGATQKVINNGTKVSTATSNTVISQECQDAFYGCMDSFCMIDNVSGGRCQCSDRNDELLQVMDEIAKLDEQSYIMATEGVERIQMGEAEEQIIARAKAAAEKSSSNKKEEDNKKKARTLDLSAWNNSVFDEDEDVFEKINVNEESAKSGAALYNSSAKMCVQQMPTQCVGSLNMLQSVYAQKIKSDCMAFENSLKQQKVASTQKLQTAQKALRDAALEEYKNQNKYDLGECVIAFSQCMQTTAGCGNDYTGCVTLAAKENVANNKSGQKAKQTTIKGAVAGSNITLAATTMESLLAKKEICRGITKQCVNSNQNDEVWTAFLRNAAPALKSAEEIAEQNLRMECIPTLADCFQKACKSNIDPKDTEGSFDMCLSNPLTYKSLCKVQLEPCLAATGGTYEKPENSSLWNGLMAALNAMRVDACTKEVKDCLTAETACHEDYSACVGLDTQTIVDLCPVEKLTACQADNNYKDTEAIKEYVAKVAQGIALNIDNSMLATCQTAVDKAMINVCGSKDDCANATVDLSSLATLIKVEACKYEDAKGESKVCYPDVQNFADNAIYIYDYEITWEDANTKTNIKSIDQKRRADADGYGVFAVLSDRPDISAITYDGENFVANAISTGFSADNTNKLVEILNNTLKGKLSSVEVDQKVQFCLNGREFQTTDGSKMGNKGAEAQRFPNLTSSARNVIASSLLSSLTSKNAELEKTFEEKLTALDAKIAARMAEVAEQRGSNVEDLIDAHNAERCMCNANKDTNKGCLSKLDNNWNEERSKRLARAYIRQLTDWVGTYDAATNICTVTKKQFSCKYYLSPSCRTFDEGTVLDTSTVQMTKFK